MHDREPIIDVIVPIYNVEAYLSKCLDGFAIQFNDAFRVLLIDDGSTDNSGEIARNYAKKIPERFLYFRQENKGLGAARNTGLTHVEAPYVWFFDSDDFCAPRAIEHLVKAIQEHEGVDAVFFNPTIFDMATHGYEPWHDEEAIRKLFADKEILAPKDEPLFFELQASVCRNVWRSAFLRELGLQFPEGLCWEDVPPHFLLMHAMTSAIFLDTPGLYYYRVNAPKKAQITSGSGKTRLDMGPILTQVKELMRTAKWDKKEKLHAINFLIDYCLWSLGCTRDEYRKELVSILHGFFQVFSLGFALYYFFASSIGKKQKVGFLLLRSRLFHNVLSDRSKIQAKKRFLARIKRFFGRR